MFERFNEDAKAVVLRAQEVSRSLMHNFIGTEHVLIALLDEKESAACRVLNDRGVNRENVEALVVRMVGEGEEPVTSTVPFTPRLKKSFELALRDALSEGLYLITPEHLLLGLMKEHDGVAARIVRDLGGGAEYYQIKEEIEHIFNAMPELMLCTPERVEQQIDKQVKIREKANAELRRLRRIKTRG